MQLDPAQLGQGVIGRQPGQLVPEPQQRPSPLQQAGGDRGVGGPRGQARPAADHGHVEPAGVGRDGLGHVARRRVEPGQAVQSLDHRIPDVGRESTARRDQLGGEERVATRHFEQLGRGRRRTRRPAPPAQPMTAGQPRPGAPTPDAGPGRRGPGADAPRRGTSSCRSVATTTAGTYSIRRHRNCSSASGPSSAQCRSSITTTTGWLRSRSASSKRGVHVVGLGRRPDRLGEAGSHVSRDVEQRSERSRGRERVAVAPPALRRRPGERPGQRGLAAAGVPADEHHGAPAVGCLVQAAGPARRAGRPARAARPDATGPNIGTGFANLGSRHRSAPLHPEPTFVACTQLEVHSEPRPTKGRERCRSTWMSTTSRAWPATTSRRRTRPTWQTQGPYDVNYLRYWVNEAEGKVFCLVDAPSKRGCDHRPPRGPRPRRGRAVRSPGGA